MDGIRLRVRLEPDTTYFHGPPNQPYCYFAVAGTPTGAALVAAEDRRLNARPAAINAMTALP